MWLGHDSFAFTDASSAVAPNADPLSLSRFASLQRVIGALARMAAEAHAAKDGDPTDAGESERASS